MVNISPDQHLFILIKQACEETGASTYDYIPGSGTTYPFIHVGEQFDDLLSTNKDTRHYSINQTIHVWHNDVKKRGTTSALMAQALDKIARIKKAGGRQATLVDINKRMLTDNSTGSDLLHGVIEVTFEIN